METSFTDTLFCSHSGSYFSARCQGLKADLQRHDKSPSRSEIAPSANVPHGSGTHFCPSSDKDRSRTFSFFFFFFLSFFVTLCRFGNHLYKESIQENGVRNILSEQMPSLQPLKGHSRETWRAKTKPDVAQICAVCEEERD